ncbi:DASS family sodium-coupled anion symporter [Pelagicoccus enzymogenes]|uniref:SLC13 family permease n=1 Tax=Pelagicoccus enzymogenes TaxID=2773457 RepID=UPI00280DFD6B|nr:DASS family sodium-coupled anion symporter [Pelagicoccus enzymogenes]MDQ8200820.1 DASS family sodium-coupled anion symporter [Pelagicoccus enzymogenes]
MKISVKRAGFLAGILVFAATLFFDSPSPDLSQKGFQTLGLGAMMAIWWMTECIPLAATAFLPLAIAPLLGIVSIKEVSSAYAHPLIFLFLGGFVLSIGMERTGLHQRIACKVVSMAGTNLKGQIGGVMFVTAFLSMWMSNTATAVMMLPIAASTASVLKENASKGAGASIGRIMLLGVAYSASIGGMATLIGTPPNALLAAYLETNYGIVVGFGQWMLIGVPWSIALLIATWFLLTRKCVSEEGNEQVREVVLARLRGMGRMSQGELTVLAVFSTAAVMWMIRPWFVEVTGLDLSDTGIAIIAALLLFIFPLEPGGGRLLEWTHAEKLPWGVLVLFGGGLALAALMKGSGLAEFLGQKFAGLEGVDKIWLVAVVVVTVVFLTEVTSNTATTAGLLPLMGPVAVTLGGSPTMLAVPAALAASCAFMLPVATPPNAVVFATGELRISDMVKAGITLNCLSIVLLVILSEWFMPLVF